MAGPASTEEKIAKKVDEGGFLLCGKLWLPSVGQIFVWKVLANPLFLLLTFSVVTGRTAMRAFGRLCQWPKNLAFFMFLHYSWRSTDKPLARI